MDKKYEETVAIVEGNNVLINENYSKEISKKMMSDIDYDIAINGEEESFDATHFNQNNFDAEVNSFEA